MNQKVTDAVRELIEAVVFENCITTNPGPGETERTVNGAYAVLEAVRASEELSSTHDWADKWISIGEGDYELAGQSPPRLPPYLD